jgi:predicted Zn finger-like uncharacterized protein
LRQKYTSKNNYKKTGGNTMSKNTCGELNYQKNYQCPHCKEWSLINTAKITTNLKQITCSGCNELFTIKVEHRSTYRKEARLPGQLSFPNGKKCAITIKNIGADGIGFTCNQNSPTGMAVLKFCLPEGKQDLETAIVVSNKKHLCATFKIFDKSAIPKDLKTIRFWLRDGLKELT